MVLTKEKLYALGLRIWFQLMTHDERTVVLDTGKIPVRRQCQIEDLYSVLLEPEDVIEAVLTVAKSYK